VTVTLILAAVLLVTTIAGVLGLRRFSYRVRSSFDSIRFLAISLWPLG
jgi:hypothetical protein